MKIISNRITAMVVLMATIFFFLVITAPLPLASENTPEVKFQDGLLTVKAEETLLVPLLERIAGAADIVIFVSKEIETAKVSVTFEKQLLEDGIKRILRGFNYAAVYYKVGKEFRISVLKIYPEGKETGPMLAVINKSAAAVSETKSLQDGSGNFLKETMEAHLLVPRRYTSRVKDKKLLPMAGRFEASEKKLWDAVKTLETEMDSASDSERKQAMTMALMNKLDAFETLQRSNLNKMEAFYRIRMFNENKPTE